MLSQRSDTSKLYQDCDQIACITLENSYKVASGPTGFWQSGLALCIGKGGSSPRKQRTVTQHMFSCQSCLSVPWGAGLVAVSPWQ